MAVQPPGRNNRVILLGGALLAILGFGLALLVGRGGGSTGTSSPSGPGTPVVVAARDLGAGSTLTANDMKVVTYSSAAVPPHSYTAKESSIGKVVAVQILAGQPILDNLLVTTLADVPVIPNQNLRIPAGMVATTIPTSEAIGVGGYIQAGDRIDILTSLSKEVCACPIPEDRYSFRGLQVIKVNGSTTAGGAATSLVVLVRFEDGPYLKFLLDNASYKYVLRSIKDAEQALPEVGPVGVNEFKAHFSFR